MASRGAVWHLSRRRPRTGREGVVTGLAGWQRGCGVVWWAGRCGRRRVRRAFALMSWGGAYRRGACCAATRTGGRIEAFRPHAPIGDVRELNPERRRAARGRVLGESDEKCAPRDDKRVVRSIPRKNSKPHATQHAYNGNEVEARAPPSAPLYTARPPQHADPARHLARRYIHAARHTCAFRHRRTTPPRRPQSTGVPRDGPRSK